jgi:hypothetical protein
MEIDRILKGHGMRKVYQQTGKRSKLPKKVVLTCCDNWRGITVISPTSKILSKIKIKRIAKHVDQHLREEQAGFREECGTTEQRTLLSKQWNGIPTYTSVSSTSKKPSTVFARHTLENHGKVWHS